MNSSFSTKKQVKLILRLTVISVQIHQITTIDTR